MPAEPQQQRTADHRRQQRRDGHHQNDERHHARELILGEHVAHQGVNHHAGGGGGQTVQETQPDQLIDRLRHGAGAAGDGEDQRSPQDHRLAADAVRHRPIEQLPEGKAEHIGAERHLHAAGLDAKLGGDHRHTGQVHVDRQRHQHGQQAQNENQTEMRGSVLLHVPRLLNRPQSMIGYQSCRCGAPTLAISSSVSGRYSPGARSSSSTMAPMRSRCNSITRLPTAANIRFTWW